MNYTLYLSGGLGKIITAIPACEKFVRKNPNTIIMLGYHTPVFFGNPILTNNVFDITTKGLYDKVKDSKILTPEPYFNNDYLNGKISLADAWNQEINKDKETMPTAKIFLSSHEKKFTKIVKQNNRPTIAFQPFGNTANFENNDVFDLTMRSLPKLVSTELIKLFKKLGCNIFLITNHQIPFFNQTDFINYYPPDARHFMAAVSNCDYFVGIDSSGQHIARSFDIPGTVIMGGTNSINVTYPDFFNVINDQQDKLYQFFGPFAESFDNYLNGITTSSIMDFNDKKIKDLCNNISKHFRSSIKKK